MTRTFVITADVTVTVDADSALCKVMDAVALARKAEKAFETESYKDACKVYDVAYKALTALMDSHEYGEYWDDLYGAYCDLTSACDHAYREYAEGDFLKYFLNGVPSDEECADLCLSDWHKDIYGYRPRGERWNALVDIARAYYRDRG